MTAAPSLQLPGNLPAPDQLWRVGEGELPAHAWDVSLVQVPQAESGVLLQSVMRGLAQQPGAPVVLAIWQRPPLAVVGVFDTGRTLRGCRQLRQLLAYDQIFTVLAADLACLAQHATGRLLHPSSSVAA